jgi:hypothetical protein
LSGVSMRWLATETATSAPLARMAALVTRVF